MRLIRPLFFALALALVTPALARGASLRICWDPASQNQDTATIQAILDGQLLYPDILVGATVTPPETKRCNVLPVASSFPRGRDLTMTLRGLNAFGEPGGDSNPVTFRSPALPSKLSGVTVQIVVP